MQHESTCTRGQRQNGKPEAKDDIYLVFEDVIEDMGHRYESPWAIIIQRLREKARCQKADVSILNSMTW